MFIQSVLGWAEGFKLAFQNLAFSFIEFVPSLIFAIIVFVLGWWIGSLVSRAINQLIGSLKIDSSLSGTEVGRVFDRAGIRLNVGYFIGEVVKWFIVIVFLIASLEMLHLDQVTAFLRNDVLGYLPHVIIAGLILVLATVIAEAMGKLVTGSAKAANVHTANFLGTMTRYAIWIFAFIIALSELGIAQQFLYTLFTGIVAMLALAGGLAFGLGGKEAAARGIEKVRDSIRPMH